MDNSARNIKDLAANDHESLRLAKIEAKSWIRKQKA
jgi:hypothetical protein